MIYLQIYLLILSLTTNFAAFETTDFQNMESAINDLPLKITPTFANKDLPMIFFISGDGGWTSFDQEVCDKLASAGIPVVGLNSRKYFWKEKLPKATADEFSVAINYYLKLWERKSFVLVGYSFGACIAPYIANNFPDQLKSLLKGVYCFSPNLTGDFEIHLSDMLSFNTVGKYDVISELVNIKLLNPICVFGDEEESNTTKKFSESGIKIIILPGDHHYNKDSKATAETILNAFK